MYPSKHDFLKPFSRSPVVIPSARAFVVGQLEPRPLLAGWHSRPPGGAAEPNAHRAGTRAFATLVRVYERQLELLGELGARWALLARIETSIHSRERLGAAGARELDGARSAVSPGEARQADVGRPLREVPSTADTVAEMLESAALLLAELRLSLLRMVQTVRHCERALPDRARRNGAAAARAGSPGAAHRRAPRPALHPPPTPVPPPAPQPAPPDLARRSSTRGDVRGGAPYRPRRADKGGGPGPVLPSALLEGAPAPDGPRGGGGGDARDTPQLVDRLVLRAAKEGWRLWPAGAPSDPAALPWHVGFNFLIKVLTDFAEAPLPTSSDPFTLRWFAPDAGAMSAGWRARFTPESSHTASAVSEFREAEAFLSDSVLGRPLREALNGQEGALPARAPSARWESVAQLLYGSADGFRARKAATERVRRAADTLAMSHRRLGLGRRCATRMRERQCGCAACIQWYWRQRKAPGTFVRAFTRAQKAALRACLDAKIRRKAVGARRRRAFISAMHGYGAYLRALIILQVRVRMLIDQRLMRRLRERQRAFKRVVVASTARLGAVAGRLQRHVRRWRETRALTWAEYTRRELRTAHAPLRRRLSCAKPELEAAQALASARDAELRTLLAATPADAQPAFLAGLGACAFTAGMRVQLLECLAVLDPELARAARSARAGADGGAADAEGARGGADGAELPLELILARAGDSACRNAARAPAANGGGGPPIGGARGSRVALAAARTPEAGGPGFLPFERLALPLPPPPPPPRIGAEPQRVEVSTAAGAAPRDALGWFSRRLVQLEGAEAEAATVGTGARECKVRPAALQPLLDEQLASSRAVQLLDGGADEAEGLIASAPWALLALCGATGHLRRLAAETAAREALAPVRQMLRAAVDYDALRGRITQLHELESDASLHGLPTHAVAQRIAAKLAELSAAEPSLSPHSLLPSREPYVRRAILTGELDRCEGSRRLLESLHEWEGAAAWRALLDRRQALLGRLTASRAAKGEYKAALRTLSALGWERSVLRALGEALRAPPCTLTLRCSLPDGPPPAELARAFGRGFAADVSSALAVDERRLELMEPAEAPEGTPSGLARVAHVRFHVWEGSSPRLGHPHALARAIEGALDSRGGGGGLRKLALPSVAELLNVEERALRVELGGMELPAQPELSTLRDIGEQLRGAEQLLRDGAQLQAKLDAERSRRLRSYGAPSDAAEHAAAVGAGSEAEVGAAHSAAEVQAALRALQREDEEEAREAEAAVSAAEAEAAARSAGVGGDGDGEPPATPSELLAALSRSASRGLDGLGEKQAALSWLEGRASMLARLQSQIPRGASEPKKHGWLRLNLERLDAELAERAREPRQAVQKLAVPYAGRRILKRHLAHTTARVRKAHALLATQSAHVRTAVSASPVVSQAHPCVSPKRHADELTLFAMVGRDAARSTDADLQSAAARAPGLGAARPPTSLLRGVVQLRARPSLRREGLRQMRPGDVRAMAELIGLDMRPGSSSDHAMLWVAVEAILAPLPPHWREADTVPDPTSGAGPAAEPRFLGDVRFVNVLTGEERGEHPLLGAFRGFVQQRRSFRSNAPRRFAEYDSWMQFSDGEEGSFYHDFSTGEQRDLLPSLQPRAHTTSSRGSRKASVVPMMRATLSGAPGGSIPTPTSDERVLLRVSEISPPYKQMCSLAIRLRPCQAGEILASASALGVPLNDFEVNLMWLPEFLHACSSFMPAGWSAHDDTDVRTGKATSVSYANSVTQSRHKAHPFGVEARAVVATVRAVAEAKANWQQLRRRASMVTAVIRHRQGR